MATNNIIGNTSNPIATTALTVNSAAATDSYIQLSVNSSPRFIFGTDNSAGDVLKLSGGSALGTTDTFIMTSAGQATMPLQPCFMATPSGTLSNVTGDNTAYTVVFATEVFDQNGDFDGTSTFTAPVTGLYYFDCCIYFSGMGVAFTDAIIKFNKNAGTLFTVMRFDPSVAVGALTTLVYGGQILLYLTASDTVSVTVTVGNSTKTISLTTTNNGTFFSGYLVGQERYGYQ